MNVVLGFRIWKCSIVDELCVDDDVRMTCLCCFVVPWTHKHYSKSFWVIGGSKLGFWMKMGLENRRFDFCPDEHSLKRATRRSSERHFATPSLKFWPLAQASHERTQERTILNFRQLCTLKRTARRLSKQRHFACSLKRTVSELQASNPLSYVFLVA